ncbi:MAG: hybrid sensor histidine kinase/response regulator [bacterium]
MDNIPFWRRIGTRTLIAFVIVSIISISTTGLVIVGLSARILRWNISQRNIQIARRASLEISRYMEDSVNELVAIAEILGPMHYDSWVQSAILENLSQNLERYRSICIVNERHEIVADSFLDESQSYELDSFALDTALGGKTYLSPVRLSGDNLPYIAIALPMRIRGRSSAALMAELNLKDIWDLVDDISVGERGEAFLVSKDGVLIAHRDKARVLTKVEGDQISEISSPLSRDGKVILQRSKDGKGMLMVYVPVGGVEWIVAIQQPMEEAYLPMQAVLSRSLVPIAIGIILASCASIFLARGISKPLKRLLDGTKIIGNGDLDHRIDIRSEDEIGRLSESFNDMAESLKGRSQALVESERKYRLITESVDDMIFSLDGEGRFIFLNHRAEVISGYSREELIGHHFIEFLTPESGERALEVLRREMAKDGQSSAELEVDLVSKGGEEIALDVNAVKVFDPSGKVHIYGVARDVTEHKRMQMQLLQSEKLSSIGELISGVAHELNNSLTGVMGFAQLLLMEPNLDSGVRSDLGKILREADRARRVVQNLLTFARQYRPEKRISQINDIIESVLEIRAYDMSVSNIEVVREVDPNLPPTMVDPHQLRQVFLNIVNNAVQAMLEAHGRGRLTVGARVEGDKIKITFKDTGPGIPKKYINRIFDPFFTTKEVGKGTGLGLSVSHGIIREHGGDIYVQSKEGEGATFTIELPIEGGKPSVDRTSPRNEGARRRVPLLGLPRARILVVDDEKAVLEVVGKVLSGEGCEVDVAGSGDEALKYIRENEYDLVISDLRMPGIDGWAFHRWVKENRPHLTKKLIFITGDILNPSVQGFFQETGVLHLSKPFSIEELKRVVRICLGSE